MLSESPYGTSHCVISPVQMHYQVIPRTNPGSAVHGGLSVWKVAIVTIAGRARRGYAPTGVLLGPNLGVPRGQGNFLEGDFHGVA